jgi:hypothetical protein
VQAQVEVVLFRAHPTQNVIILCCHIFEMGTFKEETTQTTEIKKAKGQQHALLSSLPIRQNQMASTTYKKTNTLRCLHREASK